MPKQNTALLLSRYIWLIDTIYSAGHITWISLPVIVAMI